MILRQGRLVLVTGFVAFAAFFFGLGTLLTGAQPASRPRLAERAGAAQRSGDDDGFSMILAEPREHYLVGIRNIVVDPTLPPGDSVAGVDFFVDGRLVATDRRAPYSAQFDFGADIKRHTIIVTAQTAGGRRAKVSLISRAADLSGDPAMAIALVPAIVRDASGRFVDGLSVGDFILLENGNRRPILHFDDDPIPRSIVLAVQVDAAEAARGPLGRGALGFADSLMSFDSLALLGVGSLTAGGPKQRPGAAEASAGAEAEFSYDRALFEGRLADLGASSQKGGLALPAALLSAKRGLLARPRGRVLLLLLAGNTPLIGPPPPDPEAAPAAPGRAADGPPAAGVQTPAGQASPQEALAEAIEAFRLTGATLYVVVLGRAEGFPFTALQKVAEETGGEFVVSESAADIAGTCRRLSESLQHQYLLSYAPANPEREGWRSIELRPRVPEHVVQARRACFASPPPQRP